MASNYKGKKTSTRKKNTGKANDNGLWDEIILLLVLAFSILLFLSNLNLISGVGKFLSGIQFGIFGFLAYLAPILLFVAAAFILSNRGSGIAIMKSISAGILFIMFCTLVHLIAKFNNETLDLLYYYQTGASERKGGGVIGGFFSHILMASIGEIGTYVIIVIISIICIVLITERSFFGGVKKSSQKIYDTARDDAIHRKELRQERIRTRELELKESAQTDKDLRMSKKVSGVMLDTKIVDEAVEDSNDDMHEIVLNPDGKGSYGEMDFSSINIRTVQGQEESPEIVKKADEMDTVPVHTAAMPEPKTDQKQVKKVEIAMDNEPNTAKNIEETATGLGKTYKFPPISLLKKGKRAAAGDTTKQLKETAAKLQQTLNNFGVQVTITDISQGPTVTRYEMQPEQGVKVSKIVNLSDDIKLNLAATDIRIEAPIPGKAAVGIEVPNKENSTVMLRDLLENPDFEKHSSRITFAAGKDISGQLVVADIAKMPHVLIAGSTGSGKSVCINTIIMSILYKAHPDDVKLIMIDPKVVELSVYNGIPHLMIPVVTDPKKAAAALHWGVAEMSERYKKFADLNVRDLNGYNKKIETIEDIEAEDKPQKLPQIVIIVDELADLMMVAPGEVEESICRLAQLARAAGIHLIIATQRPSVDVITGLIKANMPSRIAFAVSSGVDSRTILDMNGAEKLLGKGDMLFYPQGYSKPARVQGAFVSDTEVFDVVQYLAKQGTGTAYNTEVEEKITSVGSGASGGSLEAGSERDSYFTDAGRFIIEKDKASIGMLQRVFKVGFNRAARIMDQLADEGIVGEEEGTKPRKVLMSMEEFENFIEE